MKKRLENHPHSQCYVTENNDGSLVFVSYTTAVIFLNTEAGTVECTGTYSATTRKQIGYFLKEYMPALCYHDMKAIAGKGEFKIADLVA